MPMLTLSTPLASVDFQGRPVTSREGRRWVEWAHCSRSQSLRERLPRSGGLQLPPQLSQGLVSCYRQPFVHLVDLIGQTECSKPLARFQTMTVDEMLY